jgi:hypothetical protein
MPTLTPYEQRKADLLNEISIQKLLYKFRAFMYSLRRDTRLNCFSICDRYLNNEFHDNITLSVSEKARLEKLMGHWSWEVFDTAATDWWALLSCEHSKCLTLMTLIHLWIDDIHVFDPENFETSTQSLIT